jgi:hypothetical protein
VSILALSLLSSPLPLPFVLPPYFSGSSIYQLTSLSKSIFGSRQRRTIRPSVGWSVTRLKRAELRPIGFPFGSSNFFVRYFPVCVCFRFPPRDLKASPLFFCVHFITPFSLFICSWAGPFSLDFADSKSQPFAIPEAVGWM